MTAAHLYLNELKAKLVACPQVGRIDFIREWVTDDRGYFRARLTLTNGDWLEVSEYFIVQAETCTTAEYRYQWMTPTGQLRRRWDNAPHFPELSNFPHHIHTDEPSTVVPGEMMSIMALLDQLPALI